MTFQTLKLGKQKFVVVAEREFDRLQRESSSYRRLLKQDAADVAEAERRLKNPKRKSIPLARLKSELGF